MIEVLLFKMSEATKLIHGQHGIIESEFFYNIGVELVVLLLYFKMGYSRIEYQVGTVTGIFSKILT